MELGQQTNIVCKNSAEKIKDVLYELFESKDYSDVTLICDDKTSITAHKNILGSWSPVFKNIFDQEKEFDVKGGSVYLRGVSSHEMHSLLEFIYLGETNCKLSKVNDLIELANDLQLQGFEIDYGIKKIKAQVDEEIESHADDKEEKLNENKNEVGIETDFKTIGDDDEENANQSMEELPGDDVDFTTYSKYAIKMADSGRYMCILGCNKTLYLKPSAVKKHFARNHDRSMCRHKCDICDYVGYDKNTITSHKQKHTNDIKCDKCGFRTKNKQSFDRHVNKECMSVMKECQRCGQLFTSDKRLKHHEALMHGISHMCNICGKNFENSESKDKHINNHHKNFEKTTCVL